MKKFEYKTIKHEDIEFLAKELENYDTTQKTFPQFLNYMGLDGWEYIEENSIHGYIFKREILG